MSQKKRIYGQATYGKGDYVSGGRNRNSYVYGNTAHKLDVQREMEAPRRELSPDVRRNREKAKRMSAGYIAFLAVALFISAGILVNYIQMKAELTTKTRTVAAKESYLNDLKVANDEEYNRVLSSIDLEEIKRVAIGELGMVYAEEGQIIFYENEGNDYMRQVSGK